jgi:hypothetical protein
MIPTTGGTWALLIHHSSLGASFTLSIQVQEDLPQNANLDFHNFVYAVEMKVLKGFGGGIIFRATLDNINELVNYYYFLLRTDGSYSLFVRNDWDPLQKKYNTANNQTLLISGSTSAIHTGLNQTNLIMTVVSGNTIDLYINQQKIASVSDSKFDHGTIGLFAYDSGHPNNEANPPVEERSQGAIG